ncbi:MAG TPA: KEOPS complex subunit Cgi121 [Thermoplasmata archaeon]|nr:KEOPS complex subunit Cgi121 [Thermoplasmata archaeon]
MPPLPSPEALPIWAVGARRRAAGRPTHSELISRVREASRAEEPLIALLDARGVLGPRHLLSAWAHLGRARERGQLRLRDRGAEFLLFVAGDDQLPRALSKVGIQGDTEEFVLAGEKPRAPGPLLESFGLVEAPDVYPRPASAPLLERLGIPEGERTLVPVPQWEGLVLERVALLELSAPHPAERPGRGVRNDGRRKPAPAKSS